MFSKKGITLLSVGAGAERRQLRVICQELDVVDAYPNSGELITWKLCHMSKINVSLCSAVLTLRSAHLDATTFSEEFDQESFEDLTLSKVDMIHKVDRKSVV